MLLNLENLFCTRGERELFRDFSLFLEPGEILQIAGPNGSGKTTLLRIICGLFEAESLSLKWGGESVDSALRYADELIYVGHRGALRSYLSVAENLAWLASLDDVEVKPEDIDSVLKQLNLDGYHDELVSNLSAGQRRRVSLARLELSGAKLWLLDEPFTALDHAGVEILRDWVDHFVEGGGSVILTTHQQVTFRSPSYRLLNLGVG
jgi:heme exporter protein A